MLTLQKYHFTGTKYRVTVDRNVSHKMYTTLENACKLNFRIREINTYVFIKCTDRLSKLRNITHVGFGHKHGPSEVDGHRSEGLNLNTQCEGDAKLNYLKNSPIKS